MSVLRYRRHAIESIWYTWAVYGLTYGIDESSGGTSGSVTISYSRYKMAASAYTVSNDGTISLTNSTQTTAMNLAVGQYLVDISANDSTATTGTTLYKITAVSGTTSRKITYTAYTPSLSVKGEDTGKRITLQTPEYPVFGIYGALFYQMIRGVGTVHVWNMYKVATSYGYKEKSDSGANLSMRMYTNSAPYYGSSYTFNKETGRFTIENAKRATAQSNLTNNWWIDASFSSSADPPTTTNATHSRVRYGCSSWDWAGYGNVGTIVATKGYGYTTDTSYIIYKKGSSLGTTVESADPNDYPENSQQDGIWYVYAGTVTKYFDHR